MFAARLAHLFVPQASNNHRARVLHARVLVLVAIGIFGFQLSLRSSQILTTGVLGYASQIPAHEVVNLTNEKRAEAGRQPLRENPRLSEAATSKGSHMLANDYWAHTAPDGTEPWKFFSDVGYVYRFAGENLARDFSSPQAAIDAWMASPSHRENMLSNRYDEIGIGVVEGELNGVDTTIVVQLFGKAALDTIPSVPVASAQTVEAASVPEQMPTPTPTPTPIPLPGLEEDAVLIEPAPVASPFDVTRGVSLFIIGGLISVTTIDAFIVASRGINRRTARPLAHISFFGMILVILLIARAGEII